MSDSTTTTQNAGPLLLAVIWSEAAFTSVVMIARFYTRLAITKSPGYDDFWMTMAWVTALLTNAMDTVAIHYAVGKHEAQLTPHQRIMATFWEWNSFTPGNVWNAAGKIAFACTLLRIVVVKWHKCFLYSYIAQLVVLEVIQIFLNYFQCKNGRPWIQNSIGECWNPHVQESYALAKGCYIVVADFVLALFPLLIIRKLQVSKKTRIGLMCIMCLGVFATVCSCLKTYYDQTLSGIADFTWLTRNLVIWFTSENYAIMVAGSIPTLPALYKAIKAHSVSKRGRSASASDELAHSIDSRRMSNPRRTATSPTVPPASSEYDSSDEYETFDTLGMGRRVKRPEMAMMRATSSFSKKHSGFDYA